MCCEISSGCTSVRAHKKGVLAKNKDLMKAFGTNSQLEVCRIILDKGEMQVRCEICMEESDQESTTEREKEASPGRQKTEEGETEPERWGGG